MHIPKTTHFYTFNNNITEEHYYVFTRYRPNEEIEQQSEKWSEENDEGICVKHNAMVIVNKICSSLAYISYLKHVQLLYLSFSAK